MIAPSLPRTTVQISAQENLRMVVYVLGRPAQGEMIVTLLKDNDEVKFSILTDCYLSVSRHVRKFANWCRTIGIDHFDAMIFTHPDVDHCTGVCELIKEMDAEHTSMLFIPNQMFSVSEVSEAKIRGPFQKISDEYVKNGRLYLQMRKPSERSVMFELEFQSPLQDTTIMQFVQIATDEYYICAHNLHRKPKASHNDLSLAYSIRYNNQNFLYCADIPGEYVRLMDNEYLRNVRFVKIPHHGSRRCEQLPARLLANGHRRVVSATTTFHGKAKRKRLPHDEVLSLYKEMGEVYCTGPNVSVASEYEYGGIRIDCCLSNNEIETTCFGNAYQYVTS